MDENQKRYLREKTDDITRAIRNDINSMVVRMITYNLADDTMTDAIMSERGANINGQALALHNLALRRGPGAFEKYYRCLREIHADPEITQPMRRLFINDYIHLAGPE